MDNINGALAFKATLDINDFNVSAQAMERSIKQVSSTAVSESSVMDNSIQSFAQNGAKYIVSYLVGQGMGTLLQSIVQTRGQFQQLEIAFTTMLKSGTQAKGLMNRLIDTAAKTPFDLSGVASSAKQMLAYGSTVDNVVDELVMLGNVASGEGKLAEIKHFLTENPEVGMVIFDDELSPKQLRNIEKELEVKILKHLLLLQYCQS
jgi:hypothetical protein